MRKTSFWAFGLWSIMAFWAAVADYHDQVRAGATALFAKSALLYTFVFLPFFLLSVCLLFLLARVPRILQNSSYLALLYGLLILFCLPLYGMYETALVLILEHQDLPSLGTLFWQPSAANRWLDATMISLAFVTHITFSYWQAGQQQAQAVRSARLKNTEHRLQLLQGQLEPVFLQNAVAGIMSLVRDAERSMASTALARLSNLLRYVLRATQASVGSEVSVADEIQFLRDYFQLQSLRFGSRLVVHWEVDPCDWSLHDSPALLLHSVIAPSMEACLCIPEARCNLSIAIALRGWEVLVSVEQSSSMTSTTQKTHAPILERLNLLYGADATLSYHQINDVDSRTVLVFPAHA